MPCPPSAAISRDKLCFVYLDELSIYRSAYLHTYIHTYLLTYLPAYLSVPTYPSTYTYLPVYLPMLAVGCPAENRPSVTMACRKRRLLMGLFLFFCLISHLLVLSSICNAFKILP